MPYPVRGEWDIGANEANGDSDGIPDYEDNCPDTANGPKRGTCTKGAVGSLCWNNDECGADGFCSMNQEDADNDGIGDVCDNCPAAPNGPEGGTCICGNEGELCMSDGDCGDCGFCGMNQEDTDSDGIGDACDTYIEPNLCQAYCNKCKSCLALQSAGREVDYNVCKNLSSQGQTACEAAGCTWYQNSRYQAYPCMLDICLMDWDGNNGVGPADSAIFIREQGKGNCPTPEAPLCQKYLNKYQTCLALHNAGREVDYNVCKNLSSQGQTACEDAGCTWHKNSPTAKYPCMLDLCLMDWDGTNGVGTLDVGIFKREQGRSCP